LRQKFSSKTVRKRVLLPAVYTDREMALPLYGITVNGLFCKVSLNRMNTYLHIVHDNSKQCWTR